MFGSQNRQATRPRRQEASGLRGLGHYTAQMRFLQRATRFLIFGTLGLVASHFALKFGTGRLWHGLGAAHAVTGDVQVTAPYDLTQLRAVNETLDKIRNKYVDPQRVNPRQMFLSALNQIQRRVAQVIVLHDEGSPSVKVRVFSEEREFRVDNVQGPWDVSARLREVFEFLQARLRDTDMDLAEIEYAACNGMLQTLDPHSVFLSPEAYAEMNLSTSGHFGGLGIVIAIRDQMLTVMRPMPDTPAGRAGLRRLDRILKINNEATINMPLDDAVKRLRGEPGSKVTVWVRRDGQGGWKGTRPFDLTREEIRIESVEARELGDGVGYVRLKQFQATSSRELAEALARFHKKGPLKGLVLDLRGNPGGLLHQAQEVTDRFLDHGVIVSTVETGEAPKRTSARRSGTEPRYPLVVLVDGSSASASEIVSGALKNHDRAVLVGQTTFGKGSVQVVFSNVAGDAALKLTIAQYLTPGDISIQGVGVTPDIELDPMTADRLEMDLFRQDKSISERDLSQSLTHDTARTAERPWTTLRYNLPEVERMQWRERGGQMGDEFFLDFPIRFARDLAKQLPAGKARLDQLTSAKDYLEKEQQRQLAAVATELKGLGIDWTAPPASAQKSEATYSVDVATDRPDNTVVAGESMALKVAVTNSSDKPVYRLRAITKSDAGYYDEKELAFGRVEPGQTVVAEVPLGFCDVEGHEFGSTRALPDDAPRVCTLPMSATTREDVIKVRFSAEGSEPPAEVELRATVRSLPQPTFAYTYQVVDNRKGNGDGQVSPGEDVTLYLDVTNIGKGKSYETQALLQNLTGDGLLLRAGRFDLSNLEPGDTKRVAFTFDVRDDVKENVAKLRVAVEDRDLRVGASEKIEIPLVSGGFFVNPENVEQRTVEAAAVRAQPLANARVVGSLGAASGVRVLGRFGDYAKVSLGDDRFGFVMSSELSQGPGQGLAFDPLMTRSPPTLELDPAPLSTRSDHIKVGGIARDGDRVLDTFIYVGSRKAFYSSNRDAAQQHQMRFEHEVALQPGVNVINVVARENEDVVTAETLVIRRDGPNGEYLPSPKNETFGADWTFNP